MVKLLKGDCLQKLKELEDNSIDSVVTDPPYHLTSIVKRFGKDGSAEAQYGTDGAFQRASKGFMGKEWDGLGEDGIGIANNPELWKEVLRVLKPGGHLLSFSHSRTYHRQAVAVEDAGFEIRDQIMWVYGSGFPKSHNIGKALDKNGGNNHLVYEVAEKLKEARESRGISKTQADELFCNGSTNYSWLEGRKGGVRLPEDDLFQKIVEEWPELKPYQEQVKSANREIVGKYDTDMGGLGGERLGSKGGDITLPSTPIAQQYEGWGTALKPAHEPIVMARKPFKGTVAQNVLEHGTGGINIDGCRVGTEKVSTHSNGKGNTGDNGIYGTFSNQQGSEEREGRFPANIIFECTCDVTHTKPAPKSGHWPKGKTKGFGEFGGGESSYEGVGPKEEGNMIIHTDPNCPCKILDEQSGNIKGGKPMPPFQGKPKNDINFTSGVKEINRIGYDDTGGASRFFYCPKASKKDRNEGCDGLPQKANVFMSPDSRTNKEHYDRTSPGMERFKTEPKSNHHPTVKPTDLMAYLVRLVTPKGGTVLDPFMGSGSTGKACVREGFDFVGIEREDEYMEIAKSRIEHEQGKNKHRQFFDE